MENSHSLPEEIKEVYELMVDVFFNIKPIEHLTLIIDTSFKGYGTASHEIAKSKKDLIEMARSQSDQSKHLNLEVTRNHFFDRFLTGKESYLIAEEIKINMVESGHVVIMRLTSVLEKLDGKWLITHFHGSTPDENIAADEALPDQGLKKKNAELEAKIKERTRELEIEVALEKVRAASLTMQVTDDISAVVEVYFEQLNQLKIEFVQAWINVFHLDKGYFDIWLSPLDGVHDKVISFRMPSALFEDTTIKSWKKGKPFSYLSLSSKAEIDDFMLACDEVTKSDYFSKTQKHYQLDTLEIVYANYKFGAVSKTTRGKPTAEDDAILKRFAKVFEQSYTRFLDLQKAEAQAREAQVEAALERVRARSMAMHKSEEILEVILVVSKQLAGLGFEFDNVSFGMEKDEGGFEFWMRGASMPNPFLLQMPLTDNQVMQRVIAARTDGEDFFSDIIPTQENKKWLEHVLMENDIPELKESVKEAMLKTSYTRSTALETNSFLTLGNYRSIIYTEEQNKVLKRFARVFEMAYTRFLDLQKAEDQAREAQIEAALERVRSRGMAMHKSEELLDVITVVSEQLLQLNFRFAHVSFANNELDQDYKFWVSARGMPDPMQFTVPYVDIPMINNMREAQRKGVMFYTDILTKQEARQWHKHLLSHGGADVFPKEVNEYSMSRGMARSIAVNPNIILILANYASVPYSEDENKIITRFGQVFEQSYTRFLDLQKAEAQVREAQIEAALEKVRSRSLAMHRSEELADLSLELVKQVQALGEATWFCAFNIYDDDPRGSLEWGSNGEGTFPKYRTPREGVFLRYYKAGQQGKTLLINEIGPEECPAHYDYLCSLPGVGEQLLKMKANGIPFPESQIDHVAYFKYGYVLFITYDPVPELHDVFKRFAKVFEQSYTRFLDLQKVEAQAREAEIELALERVRARTMAMQHSDELPEAANLLFLQIQSLGINAWSAGYNILNEDKKSSLCVMSSEGVIQTAFQLPFTGEKSFREWHKAIKKGEDFFVQELGDQALVEHYDYLMSLPGVQEAVAPIEAAGHSLPTYQINHLSFFKQGFLLFITYEPVPEAHELFKRFTAVFEQTYTRFLDLQKAETQVREAQIEAALERVRSQAMAMHSTEDLGTTIMVLFEQLEQLFSSEVIRCGAGLLTRENTIGDITSASRAKKGEVYHVRGIVPFTSHPILKKAYQHYLDQKELEYVLQGPELGDYYKNMSKVLATRKWPATEKHFFYFPMFEHGSFYAVTKTEMSADERNTLRRFSSVLSLTYQRFKDLQQAEVRARESQIEAAVERVRAEAMAMHHPSDLVNVTQVLIHEISNLGIDGITGAAFMLVDENDIVTMWDISDPGNMGFTRDHKSIYNPKDFKMLGEFWRKWKMGEDYFVIKYDLEKNKKGLEEWKIVDEENYNNLKRAIEQNKLKTQWNPYGSFSKGLLTLDMLSEPDSDTKNIVIKMAKTFDLAYQRFDDLQKAEEQAREAKKQASLDRIRAEIASMRNQKDLELITPLIWSELSALEVPFFRCGVFIIEEYQQQVHVYLSTPGGESIAAINFKFGSNQITDEAVEYWKKQEIYKAKWTREEFISWSKDLLDQGLIPNVKSYQHDEEPPENLHLQFIPFNQGMLYIGSDHFLDTSYMELIEDIANDFSIAYARYEDFVKLEKAKYQTETAYGELKSTQTQLIHSEKMASLGELTAGIAHEIQNPLNFVNNFSDLNIEMVDEMFEAMEAGDLEEVKDIIANIKSNEQKIKEHGKRAEDIVKGMLQHSRGGDGKKELTDINKLADEYLRLSYHGLRAKDKSFNADFKCSPDKSLPKIDVVPQDIGRVLLNLLNNAFHAVAKKATEVGDGYMPTVEVTTENKTNGVKIVISDNGSGIPDDIKEKIFQPFFTTKPTGEGTGLGLSLSYDIVTKGHGGTINLESRVGKGTAFTINLPIE